MGNQGGNAGNRGGNAGNQKVYKVQFSFFPETKKKTKLGLS